MTRRAALQGITIASAAGVGAALLAACGGSGAISAGISSAAVTPSTTATRGTATSAAPTTAQTAATTASAVSTISSMGTSAASAAANGTGKGLTLTYISPDNQGRHDAESAIFADFTKANPGISVEILSGGTSWDTTKVKFLANFASGQPVNLYESGFGFWVDVQAAIMEYSSLMARDKLAPKDIFLPPALDAWTDDAGKLWALPVVGLSQDALAYNQDLFDAAGLPYPPIDPNDASWTMEHFLESAQQLTKPDQLQFGFGGTVGGFDGGGMTRGTFFGQGPWDATTQKAQMDQPGQVQGLQFFKDLRDKYKVQPNAAQKTAIGAKGDIFTSGKIGMQVIYGYVPKQTFRWGLAALPHNGSQNVSGRQAATPLMGTKTAYSEQTWTLLKWLMVPANAARFPLSAQYAVSPVVGASAISEQAYQESVGVDPKAFELMAAHSHASAWAMSKQVGYPSIRDWLTKNFTAFDQGQQSASDWGKEATAYINANLLKP